MTRILPSLALLLLAAPAWAGTPRASSELRDSENNRYPASQAFDGLLQTAWAEGELGDGVGSWLELDLGQTTDVSSVSIWPGNLSGTGRVVREYGRPKLVRVTLLGAGEPITVEKHVQDPSEHGPLRVDVDIEGKARKIRIDIDEVFPGGIYADTFIAEVAVNFAKGTVPSSVERVKSYLASDAGKRAIERNREEVIGLYDQVKGSEFGDRDAFLALADRASDGAPFLRKQVQSQVPAGFRLQALPPDDVAIEALLKIKDSNAIPSIDRAALRTFGAESKRYAQYASVFRAHQDLVGGARVSVPPWGQTGFARGALQSLGEPLQLEIDQFGGTWVADVANNRVQRFGVNGTVEKVWCVGEPEITNVWFQGTRDHYAAACTASDAPGGFANPVDLAVVPGKDSDSVVVLDAAGKVTVIGGNDEVVNTWKVPASNKIISGVGGEGYVVWAKNRIVVLYSNEGFAYTLDGEELGRFQIEDGVPTGAVGLKNGKLGLIFGRELVLYSADGFRHGDVMNGALGTGFEAWDVTLDEAGKLWAITDTGVLAKFKRPGKVDYMVQLGDYAFDLPRLDVYDDLVFVTDDDAIEKIDALELHAQQELERAEAEAAAKAAEAEAAE